MGVREEHERLVDDALLLRSLRRGAKQTFTKLDGTKMVCIPREKFLDLIEGVGGEEEDYVNE